MRHWRSRINWKKSDIHFSSNVPRTRKMELCSLMCMRECSHRRNYPFCKFKNKVVEFNYVAKRLATKLACWKLKHLSLAGQNTLIKSVALAIPSYIMQVFLLSVSICDKIDRLMWRFFWGARNEEKRFLSLRTWDNICTLKMAGELGIRRTRDMNTAYITKLS